MVVSVTGSTTNGQPLEADDLDTTVRACDVQLQLDADKRKLVALVEARMDRTAPNLSAVLGPEVASKLMSVAGGLVALSKMPANNVQVLGQKRKSAAGMSSATRRQGWRLHVGFINQCDIIQRKLHRHFACAPLAGRRQVHADGWVDAFGEDPSGSTGRNMHEEMVKKIESVPRSPSGQDRQALAIPGGEVKAKRRQAARAWKERFGASDMRKAANRVNFNVAEEEIEYEGEGLGTSEHPRGWRRRAGSSSSRPNPRR